MKLSNITNNIQNSILIVEQKKCAINLLSEISKHFDCVAGGAPRNWEFNMPANDLDIYVPRRIGGNQKEIDRKIANAVKGMSEKYGFGENKAFGSTVSVTYGGFILHSLYDFSTDISPEKKQNCQFIIIDGKYGINMSNSEDFANRIFRTYDFGICKIAMDKDGNIIKNNDFEEDVKNKTFTCNIREFKRNNEAGLNKLVQRFEKMQNYFPDHKMKIVSEDIK